MNSCATVVVALGLRAGLRASLPGVFPHSTDSISLKRQSQCERWACSALLVYGHSHSKLGAVLKGHGCREISSEGRSVLRVLTQKCREELIRTRSQTISQTILQFYKIEIIEIEAAAALTTRL